MQTIERPPEFSHDRRRFLGVAALSLAPMQLGPIGPAKAQGGPAKPARPAAIKPGTNTSFAALKQIDAGLLNVGYAEARPADGPPVLLLHCWAFSRLPPPRPCPPPGRRCFFSTAGHTTFTAMSTSLRSSRRPGSG